jgi:hypothetical protein
MLIDILQIAIKYSLTISLFFFYGYINLITKLIFVFMYNTYAYIYDKHNINIFHIKFVHLYTHTPTHTYNIYIICWKIVNKIAVFIDILTKYLLMYGNEA